MGVKALSLTCNLSGGSVGTIQLYDLLQTYLLNPAARDEINHLVGGIRKQHLDLDNEQSGSK
jgi:hypothetical protein